MLGRQRRGLHIIHIYIDDHLQDEERENQRTKERMTEIKGMERTQNAEHARVFLYDELVLPSSVWNWMMAAVQGGGRQLTSCLLLVPYPEQRESGR